MAVLGLPFHVLNPDPTGREWNLAAEPDTYAFDQIMAGQVGEDFLLWQPGAVGRSLLLSSIWLSVSAQATVEFSTQPFGGGVATMLAIFSFPVLIPIPFDTANGVLLDVGAELHWTSSGAATVTVIGKEVQ